MATPRFVFGRCTTPTFGSVALDLVDLPRVRDEVQANHSQLGGQFTALDGTRYNMRIAMKRHWSVQLQQWMDVGTWWPVLRFWEGSSGPWMFYDQTRPNLIPAAQRLLTGWVNSAGSALTVRADGATSLTSSGTAWQSITANADRTILAPVTAGSQYTAAATVRGAPGWAGSIQVQVVWYPAAGTTAISTTTIGTFTPGTALSTCLVLDGSVTGYRVGGTATAPALATHAGFKFTASTAAVDVSDPVIVPGPTDTGNQMFVVTIDEMPESIPGFQRATLNMQLTEC